ncbi:hypothetical protein [Leifsonia shinshuensis]
MAAARTTKNSPERDKNVTFYQSRAEATRARSAWAATQYLPGGYRSFTAMVAAAVMHETARLAKKFNDGQPFKPLPAGAIKRGRRPGPRPDASHLVQQTYSQKPSDTAAARGAWAATQHLAGGYDSFADMVATAVNHETIKLENRHNGGKPFPEPGTENLRPGRRPAPPKDEPAPPAADPEPAPVSAAAAGTKRPSAKKPTGSAKSTTARSSRAKKVTSTDTSARDTAAATHTDNPKPTTRTRSARSPRRAPAAD